MAFPKKKTLAVIVAAAALAGLTSFGASTFMLQKQLASVRQVETFNFRGIDMQLKQVDVGSFSCFLVVYDNPEKWDAPQIHFNCPK